MPQAVISGLTRNAGASRISLDSAFAEMTKRVAIFSNVVVIRDLAGRDDMTETPIRSGIAWVDALFDACVNLLIRLAHFFGVSYNEINIWIFCVIWPILTVTLCIVVVFQLIAIKKLRKEPGRS
jgi:hypothetical protein